MLQGKDYQGTSQLPAFKRNSVESDRSSPKPVMELPVKDTENIINNNNSDKQENTMPSQPTITAGDVAQHIVEVPTERVSISHFIIQS